MSYIYIKKSAIYKFIIYLSTFRFITLLQSPAIPPPHLTFDLWAGTFQEKDYEQADRYADLAMSADRYNPAALINKGNTCFVRQDYDKAEEFYREALRNDSSCTEALYNLGELPQPGDVWSPLETQPVHWAEGLAQSGGVSTVYWSAMGSVVISRSPNESMAITWFGIA